MRYQRFKDIPVWNAAIDLAVSVFALTSEPEFKSQHSLRDQLERAAVSVSTTSPKDSKEARIKSC